jgi:hypothetical protein
MLRSPSGLRAVISGMRTQSTCLGNAMLVQKPCVPKPAMLTEVSLQSTFGEAHFGRSQV